MRGEQTLRLSCEGSSNGSSPRARGTARWIQLDPEVPRFIPACAGNRSLLEEIERLSAVHPRVRGEQSLEGWLRGPTPGSSPRARGTARSCKCLTYKRRFIPACAGNSFSAVVRGGRPPVHPRVRGEQPSTDCGTTDLDGSSPRARGTVLETPHHSHRQRFIPACAGNRRRTGWRWPRSTVHPRVRGEQFRGRSAQQPGRGSSPRARGTVFDSATGHDRHRFIPACAGNRCVPIVVTSGKPVHPRVRGEQISSMLSLRERYGSSPRARGTGSPYGGLSVPTRFIPACAGNSWCRRPRPPTVPVHPRVRGEQMAMPASLPIMPGSSPRARGTGNVQRSDVPRHRFIPACAGNSRTQDCCRSVSSVHPRVRGEQTRWLIGMLIQCGSSPRARGTAPAPAPATLWFIPACAGNR